MTMARGPIQKKNGFWADFINAALMRPVYRDAEKRAEASVPARSSSADRVMRPKGLVVVSSSISRSAESSATGRLVPKIVIAPAVGRKVRKSVKTGRFVSRASRSSRIAPTDITLRREPSTLKVVPKGESVISVHAATTGEGVQALKEWLAALETAQEKTDAPKQGV